MEPATREKEKFDIRKILLISTYTILAIGPASVWANLTMGLAMSSAAQFFALFLFSEIMRLSAKPPKVQEAFLIYFLSSNITVGMTVVNWIYNAWFRISPMVQSFGFANEIADWFAPPPSSNVLVLRTFFLKEWTVPIALYITFYFLSTFSSISLGLITYKLYGQKEKLPFPLGQVAAQFCHSMVEMKGEKERLFTIGAFIGLAWSFLAYGTPLISRGIFEIVISPIPIPWMEFNKFIEIWLPGASFGVSTDLVNLVIGMIVPSIVAYSIFIGSFTFQFAGNFILVRQGIYAEWTSGTNLALAMQRSILYFWTSPIIGMGLSAGVIPLFLILPRMRLGGLTFSISKDSFKSPLLMPMIIFLASSLSMVGIAHFLVPDYPIWIFLILSVGWSLVLAFISARTIGMSGLQIDIPHVAEGLYIASGYRNIDIFFLPPMITVGGGAWCQTFKIAELTKTPIEATIKPALILLPISLIVGFASVAFAWSLFAIPSSFYPWTERIWPVNATTQALWISALSGRGGGQTLTINPQWVLISFLVMTAVQLLKIPVSAVSIVLGATLPIPSAFTILLGLIVVKFIERFKGKEWWIRYRSDFTAGMLLGLGIPIIIGAAVALIAGSIWPMPY